MKIKVWDIGIRLFHWLLVIFIIIAYMSIKNGATNIHEIAGYVIGLLLFFRIIWGFVGTKYALFKNFIYSPKVIFRSFISLFSSKKEDYLGHNPLGGVSVILMIFFILIQFLSGLFADDDILFSGPLSSYINSYFVGLITFLHKQNFNIIFYLIILHIAAIFFYSFIKKNNLIKPMLTGYKRKK